MKSVFERRATYHTLGSLSKKDGDGNIRKRHLTSEFVLIQTQLLQLNRTYSIRSRSIRQMLAVFSGLKSWSLIQNDCIEI